MWKICCFLHRVLTQTAGTCRCMFTAANREDHGLPLRHNRDVDDRRKLQLWHHHGFSTLSPSPAPVVAQRRRELLSLHNDERGNLVQEHVRNPRFFALSGRELLSCTTTGKTTTCPSSAPGESQRSAAQQAICVPCLCGITAMSSTLTMN